MARYLGLSPQALHERLTPPAQAFLHALLVEALKRNAAAARRRLGLLDRFTAVIVEDTTTVALPADLADEFPGCDGGHAGGRTAALKILIRFDVRTGELLHLSVHAGRTSDKVLAARADELPAGSLHLADQGSFDSRRWQQFGSKKYWISRVPAGTAVRWQGSWQALDALPAEVAGATFDAAVGLVERTDLACRLVALRCPDEVVARRRQKLREHTRSKKGREPSARQLRLCAWTVFATNVPVEKLAAKAVWLVYRCRWQVELLFKRAKQQGGLGRSRGKLGRRVIVECDAKLLGLVVAHWGTPLRGGPLGGVSPVKRFAVVQDFAAALRRGLAEGGAIVPRILADPTRQLAQVRAQPKRSKKTSTRQTMLDPKVAA
jgi:hypothetical protein